MVFLPVSLSVCLSVCLSVWRGGAGGAGYSGVSCLCVPPHCRCGPVQPGVCAVGGAVPHHVPGQ